MNRTFVKSVGNWIIKNYDVISDVFTAAFSIVCSLIASTIHESLSTDAPDNAGLFIKIVLITFVLFAIICFSLLSRWVKNKYIVKSRYKDYIEKAYLKIQELSFESQMILQKTITTPIDANCLLRWSLQGLQKAIDKCFDFFIASFGKANEFIEEIRFEVTFMTLSYYDGELTIAGYANRERIKPTSMQKREVEKDHYKETVAAELYKKYDAHDQPTMIIISDTEKPIPGTKGKPYKELYEGQRKNAKSSIIVPVLSRKSELLGVMVVYCNQKDFFVEEDRSFWEEMTHLFTVEIGSYKLILDALAEGGEKPF